MANGKGSLVVLVRAEIQILKLLPISCNSVKLYSLKKLLLKISTRPEITNIEKYKALR